MVGFRTPSIGPLDRIRPTAAIGLGARGHSRGIPIALSDRPWIPFWTMIALGPIVPPTVEQVRDCFRLLGRNSSDHLLLSRIDREALRWHPVPQSDLEDHLGALVTEGAALDEHRFEARLLDYADAREHDLPVKVIVGPDSMTLLASHAVGDGRFMFALLTRLARCSSEPEAILDLEAASSDRTTIKALTDYYARKPSHMLVALRSARPAPDSSAVNEPAPHPGDGTLSPRFIYHRFDRASWSAVRAIRNADHPKTSVAATLFSLVCRAFGQSDIGVDPEGFFFLVDNRRYLRGAAPLCGNMAKSIYIRPGELGNPAAIDSAMDEALDAGRPLVSAAVSAVKEELSRRRTRRTGESRGSRGSDQVALSLSFLSHSKALEALPWRGGADRWCGGFATTGAASGISITFIPIRGELHMSISFVPECIPEALVREAVDRLQTTLTERRGDIRFATTRFSAPETEI